MANYKKKPMKKAKNVTKGEMVKPAKSANIGRLATMKKGIDPNPAGRTVYMETGSPWGKMKKSFY